MQGSHLLGVHGGGTDRVDDHHVGPGVCVDEVSTIALAQGMHDTGLIQVEQSCQVLTAVK